MWFRWRFGSSHQWNSNISWVIFCLHCTYFNQQKLRRVFNVSNEEELALSLLIHKKTHTQGVCLIAVSVSVFYIIIGSLGTVVDVTIICIIYTRYLRCLMSSCSSMHKPQSTYCYETLFLSDFASCSGPIFCLLLGVSSGCAQPITGHVTSVTWPVIGLNIVWAFSDQETENGPWYFNAIWR